MSTLSKTCKAKNPANCRYHGQPLQKLEKMLTQVKTSSDYLHVKSLIEEQKVQIFLDSIPKKALQSGFNESCLEVEINDSKGDRFYPLEKWVDLWVNDENGKPIGYAKIHVYHDEENGNVNKVSLCDIEINPEFAGRNAALSTLRKMKDFYNVPHIECGSTFSEKGHAMYKKLRGHELTTGETVLKLDKYTAAKEYSIEGYDSYSFVKNWDDKTPKYRL